MWPLYESIARSISTAGSFLILPASLYSHCSKTHLKLSRPVKHGLQLNPLWLPSHSEVCCFALREVRLHAHTLGRRRCADLPEKPNRTRWQMCHGNNSPCHLFFGASTPNPSLSVPQSRTEWNTSPIMGKQLIMHYQLVPSATDRCLAGGTRPFRSFRTILSRSPDSLISSCSLDRGLQAYQVLLKLQQDRSSIFH